MACLRSPGRVLQVVHSVSVYCEYEKKDMCHDSQGRAAMPTSMARAGLFIEQKNIFMPYPTANLGFAGHVCKSIDAQTTLMTLVPLAYRPLVMT